MRSWTSAAVCQRGDADEDAPWAICSSADAVARALGRDYAADFVPTFLLDAAATNWRVESPLPAASSV